MKLTMPADTLAKETGLPELFMHFIAIAELRAVSA